MNVKTKNLCIRNINIAIAKQFYTLSIYKNYTRKAKKRSQRYLLLKFSNVVITESQLKKFLKEEIKKELKRVINEANGVVDERFLSLAEWIIKRYSSGVKKNRYGERFFTVPSNVFKKYNIYDLPFENLKVEIIDHGNDCVRGGYYGAPELCLRDDTLWSENKAVIAHELAHIVQKKDRSDSDKSNARGHYTLGNDMKELSHDIAYDFDPNELQARLTEAAISLKKSVYTPKMLKNALVGRYGENYRQTLNFGEFYNFILRYNGLRYDDSLESILRLYHMEIDIKKINEDRVLNFIMGLRSSVNRFSGNGVGQDNSGPVFGLFMTRPWYLKKIIPEYEKLLGEPEMVWKNGNQYRNYKVPGDRQASMWFVVLKSRLVNYFEDKLEEYKKKISKTLSPIIKKLYDEVMNEKPEEETKYHKLVRQPEYYSI